MCVCVLETTAYECIVENEQCFMEMCLCSGRKQKIHGAIKFAANRILFSCLIYFGSVIKTISVEIYV